MIKVQVQKEAGLIRSVCIKGHANSGVKGQDLVCAGVSCIAVGMLNALDTYCSDAPMKLVYEDGYIEISEASADEKTQLLLNVMLTQLESVELVHRKFIKITIQEV